MEKIKKKIGGYTAKASLWNTASSMVSRGLGVILTPVFTRLLSPSEYGLYPLYTSWMGIFTVIGTLEISGSIMYRTLARFEGEEDSVTSSALSLETALALIFGALYIIFAKRINDLTSLSTPLTLFLMLQVFLNAVTGIYFARKRYEFNHKIPSYINIFTGIASPLLSLILIYAGLGGMARIISPIAVGVIFAFPICLRAFKQSRAFFDLEKWRYLLRLSLPLLVHYLSLSVIAGGDRIIIAHLMPEEALGKYSAAYSVGFMLSLATGGLSIALVPAVMRAVKSGAYDGISKKIAPILDGITALALLYLAAVPEIFGIAAPREYRDAIGVIYPTVISSVLLFLSGLLSSGLLCFDATARINICSLSAALLFLASAIILISRYGYIGGALATLLGYLLLFSLNLYAFRKRSGKNLLDAKSCLQNIALLFLFGGLFYFARWIAVSRFLLVLACVMIFLPKIKRGALN